MNGPIVIVGAGPAGATLAALLAMRGREVVVFDDHKRPPLLVGESLIPSVIPVLRKLDLEDRVREFSTYKPGASFFHESGAKMHFSFRPTGLGKSRCPGYSYNVPRPQFDDLLRTRAEELGAQFITHRAELNCGTTAGRELELSAKSLSEAGLRKQPNLLIDGTGRSRLFARTLGLNTKKGPRKDLAYFAHFENFQHDEVDPGQVIISVLEHGWSWRIPLPGRLSVGIVIDKKAAHQLGETPEERLENAIATEALLKNKGANARRISDVMTYSNYQLISERGSGPGWVLLGDAFGFVDPMLSPGLFMAMESAVLLDKYLHRRGNEQNDFGGYFRELNRWHESWQELINYFYSGEMMRLHEAGSQTAAGAGPLNPAKWMEKHVSRVISSMASGSGTRSRYHRKLLEFSSKHLAWDVHDADFFAVK